jgi:hypothetical protein
VQLFVTLAATALLACAAPTAASLRTAPITTTPADRDALIAAEKAVFAAIAARDTAALDRLIADDFVVRIPGHSDDGKAAFIAAIGSIPGEILSIGGEGLTAQMLGPDLGMVSGVQVARVRVDGTVLVDRGGFVDLFARRDGRWGMTWAFGVPMSTTPAHGDSVPGAGASTDSGRRGGQRVHRTRRRSPTSGRRVACRFR